MHLLWIARARRARSEGGEEFINVARKPTTLGTRDLVGRVMGPMHAWQRGSWSARSIARAAFVNTVIRFSIISSWESKGDRLGKVDISPRTGLQRPFPAARLIASVGMKR